jgi:hypothetical protein
MNFNNPYPYGQGTNFASNPCGGMPNPCGGIPEADGRQRIVVPPNTLQQDICKFFHDEGGHPGVHRTISSIATYFFWPKMGSEIRAFVTSCEACQAAKASSRLPRGHAQPHPLPAEPGAHWTLDFLHLPTSANGFKCIFTFTDRLSKLVVLVPLKQTTVIDVAQAYVEHVFCWFGAPLSIFPIKALHSLGSDA